MEPNGSERPSSASGLGKLLPRALTEKRRRKKQQYGSDASSDEMLVRGRSPASSRHTNESEDNSTRAFPPLEEDEELRPLSIVVVDSDQDSLSARPGAISTHPSQIGYLTTSSPLVQEEHVVQKGVTDSPADPPSRFSTIATSAARTDSPDPNPLLKQTKTGLGLPKTSAARRSPSPVGRFREVFRSRGSSPSSESPSLDRTTDSAAPTASTESLASKHTKETSTDSASTTKPDTSKSVPTKRLRRLSRGQKIDTTHPPRTPPNGDQGTPVIVNTPPTPTDHTNPKLGSRSTTSSPADAVPIKPTQSTPSGNMIAHRRLRSGSANSGPSKLSNITSAPLTPTPENGPITPSTASFFSSMISAAQNVAQNAATTLTNSIANTNIAPAANGGHNKARSLSLSNNSSTSRVEVESFAGSSDPKMTTQEPAVRTLGRGDLSLSQLGISEPSSNSTTPVASKFSEALDMRSRSESAPTESQTSTVGIGSDQLSDSFPSSQTRSQHDPGSAGRSTPAGSVYEEATGVQRSGSVRSSLGQHRKRGSSAVSGGTIGAAIVATSSTTSHINGNNSTTKLTGFAVASSKRNRDFHALFKTVPDNDYLIEDYSCALQLQILAHGRLYVSEGHLCFNSNIFGYVTTLVMSFDEIVSVEKRSTALVFKNGLMISTLHAKHVFASFTSRDSTYDLIVKIWKLGHPSLQSSLNGVGLDELGGDKTEKIEEEESPSITLEGGHSGSESDDESEEDDDDDEIYDEDAEDEADVSQAIQPTELNTPDLRTDKTVVRKTSVTVGAGTATAEKPKEAAAGGAAVGGGEDFPGPATHAKTDCGDADTHFDKFLADDKIPAPLGKVYNMMFGPASVAYMSKFLTVEQKCTDLQMEDKKGLSADNKSRTYSYTKPLNAPLGPKQTKCTVTEHLDNIDLERAVNVTCSTQTPDVPSGNLFSVKTRYCLTWDENNGTRVQVNCTTEWTGKSWIKGPIEKGVADGQTQYCKDLFASLKSSLSSRSRAGGNTVGAKGKKKGRKSKTGPTSGPTSDIEGGPVAKQAAIQDWGLLEPIHGIFGPIVDILKPLMTGNVVYGLLVGLLVASWFGFTPGNRAPRHPYGGNGAELAYLSYPDRLAAYEELWRREESELWEWLEERVGLDRLGGGGGVVRTSSPLPPLRRREIQEAIRVTEEKLKSLKAAVEQDN